MPRVTLMLIPLHGVHGVLLEVIDQQSGNLFRKTLPATPQAISEAKGYLDLSDGVWSIAEDALKRSGVPFVVDGTLKTEAHALGRFPNYRRVS